MNSASFLSILPRQLRFWTFHCILNALPSLCIALFPLGLRKNPDTVAALACAIATFIVLYATLTSLPRTLADENHLLSRALRHGVRIRAAITALSLSVMWTPVGFITPDPWCGLLAVTTYDHLVSLTGLGEKFTSYPTAGFFPIYTVTMLEGVILSFLLLLISFFSVMTLQARDRREFFSNEEKRRIAGLRDQHPGLPDLDT